MSDDHHDPETTRWQPAAGSVPYGIGGGDDPTPPDPTPEVSGFDDGPPTMAVPPLDGGPPTVAIPATDPAAGGPEQPGGPDQPPSENSDRRRNVMIAGIAVVLVVIVVVIGLILALGRSSDDPPPSTAAPTSTTQRGDQRIEAHGVTIIIPAGSLEPDAELRTGLASMPTSHVHGFVPASTFLDVSIAGGAQTGPIRFEFPLDQVRTAPGDGDPILLALRVQDENTEIVDAIWDADRERYVLDLDDVAGIGVLTWDWDRIDRVVDGARQRITADPAAAGDCAPAPDEVQIDGGAGIDWCITGDDARTVRGRNLTGNAIEITWNGPAPDDPDDTTGLDRIVDIVPGWRSDDRRILGPGSSIEFTIPEADEAAIATGFSDPAAAATWIAVDADVLAGLSSMLPGDHTTVPADIIDRLDPACPAGANGIDDLLQKCFAPPVAAGLLGGAPAGYLDTLLVPEVLGAMLRTPLEAAEATLVERSRGDVRIGAAPVDGGSWPTGDDEADDTLRDALDPDWSRCTDTRCLLGVDGQVLLYRLDDDRWVWLVTVAEDTNDPAGSLLAAGADEELFVDLLDP